MSNTIIIYANYGAPYSGNFIASIYALEKELNLKNTKVIYVFPERTKGCFWAQEAISAGKKIFYVSEDSKKSIIQLKRIIKKFSPGSIYTHFVNRKQLICLKIAKAFAKKNIVVVEHFHNHYVYNDGRIKQFIKHFIMGDDPLLGCSKDVKDSFLKGGFKKNLCGFAENALDFERLDDWTESIDINNFHVLMFGFDVKRKGVDLAVKACNKLCNKYQNIVLDICLSRNEDLVRNEIQSILGNIPEWINILPAREDVATYYRGANVFISPSREEGFCYSIVEAAYCKTISVASKISGQYKENLEGIEWHESESVDDLAAKIEHVYLMSSEEYNQIASKLAQQAYEQYGLHRWVNDVIAFLEEANAL